MRLTRHIEGEENDEETEACSEVAGRLSRSANVAHSATRKENESVGEPSRGRAPRAGCVYHAECGITGIDI